MVAQKRSSKVIVKNGHGYIALGKGSRRIGPPRAILRVRKAFHLNELFKGAHASRAVEANPAVALVKVFLQAKQSRQVFAARDARGPEGERCAIINGRFRIDGFGEEFCNSVELFKGLRHIELLMVKLLKHAAISRACKQVAAVKQHLRTGCVGQRIQHAIDIGILLSCSGQETSQHAADRGINLLQRPKNALGKAAQPCYIQAKHIKYGIFAQAIECLINLVVGIDGNIDGNLRLSGVKSGHMPHDIGGGAVQRKNVNGRRRFAHRTGRKPAAETRIVHNAAF